jgi:hypothetical protein
MKLHYVHVAISFSCWIIDMYLWLFGYPIIGIMMIPFLFGFFPILKASKSFSIWSKIRYCFLYVFFVSIFLIISSIFFVIIWPINERMNVSINFLIKACIFSGSQLFVYSRIRKKIKATK